MKIKHLIILPIVIYLIYLNIYTITHFDLFYRNPTNFETFAGVIFFMTCASTVVVILFVIIHYSKHINKFLNQKL